MVRPMNDAALLVPLILSVELHKIAYFQGSNPGCQVNVVSNQQCPTRGQPQDKSLVARTVVVVGQELHDLTTSLYLKIALALFESFFQDRVSGRAWSSNVILCLSIIPCVER
jgi:hypothetical protein